MLLKNVEMQWKMVHKLPSMVDFYLAANPPMVYPTVIVSRISLPKKNEEVDPELAAP